MIIALETSSTDLSAAIAEPDGNLLALDGWTAGYRHASELLPRLLAMFAAADRSLRATTLVVVGDGPGSFTGLRVGMSVAKALAVAADCPLVGRPSLEAWLAAEPDAGLAISRAGAHESYVLGRGEAEPRIAPHAEFAQVQPRTQVVAPVDLASVLGLPDSRPPYRAAAALVASVAALAGDATLATASADLDLLEPRYLRAPRGVEATQSADR